MKFTLFQHKDPFKEIGYKSDQEGIMNRCIREKKNWMEHLKNSSEYIANFSEKLPAEYSIAILGSGWLLDVPIELLAKRFKCIYLIDVCHPVQLRHKFKDHANIVFIDIDLTGYAAEVVKIVNVSKQPSILDSLMKLTKQEVLSAIKFDALISVNILTQLDSLLCEYISSWNYFPPEQLVTFQQKLQSEHIELLKSKPSCIISDVREIFLNKNNSVVLSNDTLKVEWPAGQHSQSWNWVFDTNYTYSPRFKTNLSVKAEMLF